MRGDISYIAKGYSKANNKYIKNYDNSEKVNSLNIWMQMICMVGQ